jgi:hypothetical protein
MRYSLFLPFTQLNVRLANFDPVSGKLVVPNEGARAQISPLFPSTIPVVTAAQAGFPERTLLELDKGNWAPRLGFAYRIGGSATTVIRGGYGMFYDNQANKAGGLLASGGPYAGLETFDNTITAGVPLFAWPQAFPSGGGPRPLGIQDLNAVAIDLRNSYAHQFNLSLEQEFWGTGFRLSYVGLSTIHLPYRRNLNQPPASTTAFNQNRRPYTFVRNITFAESGGTQSYNAMQFEANRRLTRGLAFNAHWTWAKNLTDSPDDNQLGGLLEDPYNRRRDRGPESYTPRHRFVSTMLYELPFGRGRQLFAGASRLTDLAIGGWSLSAILQFQTGVFFTPSFSGSDPSNTNTTTGRPDRIADGNLPADSRTIDRWFDASAFTVPGTGRFGNAGRGILEGPGTSLLNLAAFKKFQLTEGVSIQIFGRAQNAFNHPNYSNPASNISVPGAVARITATAGFTEVFSGSRSIEIGGRIQF